MPDALAILEKEIRELAGVRDNRRANGIQVLFGGVMAGVLVPLSHPDIWDRWVPTIVVYYAALAAMFAAALAADTFAGERERRTLETLMTTPATELDILLGKAGAVVIFGATAGILPWIISLVIAAGRGIPLGPAVPLSGACLWLSASASFLLGTIAIGVSLQTTSARAAQQVSPVLCLLVFAGGSFLWQAIDLPLTLTAFCVTGAGALVLGSFGLWVLSRWFRRDRLFARS